MITIDQKVEMYRMHAEAYAGADGGGEMGGMNNARRATYDLH